MSNRTETAFAAALAVTASALMIATPALTGGQAEGQPYYARSAFFPWVALALVVAFGGWTAWQAWRGTGRNLSDEIEAENTSVPKALGGAALLGLYIVLNLVAGYAVSTFVVLCILGRWVALPTRMTLLLAGVVTAVLYGIFVFGFKVWFAPSLIQGWLL